MSMREKRLASAGSCGLVGYDKNDFKAFYFVKSSVSSTFDGCSMLCSQKSCASFGIGAGACFLYKATVENNVNPVPNSPYTFYDATCISRKKGQSSSPLPYKYKGGGAHPRLLLDRDGSLETSTTSSTVVSRSKFEIW
jgi:hypothetical protein